MTGESHRQRLVTVCVVSAAFIRIVAYKLDIELVKHLVKDDTRSEKPRRQSRLR